MNFLTYTDSVVARLHHILAK